MVAESNDEQLALARLRAWKDAGATLLFSFSGYSTNPFSLRVSIRGVDEPNSALVLDWLLFAIEPDSGAQKLNPRHYFLLFSLYHSKGFLEQTHLIERLCENQR